MDCNCEKEKLAKAALDALKHLSEVPKPTETSVKSPQELLPAFAEFFQLLASIYPSSSSSGFSVFGPIGGSSQSQPFKSIEDLLGEMIQPSKEQKVVPPPASKQYKNVSVEQCTTVKSVFGLLCISELADRLLDAMESRGAPFEHFTYPETSHTLTFLYPELSQEIIGKLASVLGALL